MSKRAIVALYHRDHLSRGHYRRIFGYESYHWGFVITPENSQGQDSDSYEATDATELDPVTFRMNNPSMEWWLRCNESFEPEQNPKLIGRIIIGIVPEHISQDELKAFFKTVPLPVKDTEPQQSCVTWTIDAVKALQQKGWAYSFDIEKFKDWALAYADDRLRGSDAKEPQITVYGVVEVGTT
jgi:hypothetical protein